jgi:HEAT repeat protein
VTALVLAAAVALGQGRIANGQVETRVIAQTLEREIASVATRSGARWIGYRMRIAGGRRSMDCLDRSRIALEPAAEILLLARIEAGTLVRLRTATPDCEIDAGGLPVVWLDGVTPNDSVAWLTSLIHTIPASGERYDRVVRPAVVALAMHEGTAATRSLVAIARDHEVSKLRADALFWLAQRAGDQALSTIAEAIDRDPDTDVKKRAVFALSQLPKDEGVPKLIDVARNNKNLAVRKQAMFWLGHSGDPRALKFFEDVLLK